MIVSDYRGILPVVVTAGFLLKNMLFIIFKERVDQEGPVPFPKRRTGAMQSIRRKDGLLEGEGRG